MTSIEPYDDPVFFERYQTMRQRGAGLNEDLEQPAIIRLLPSVADADVLDIGCGNGTLAWRFASLGARRVLGIDLSARMLTLAASRAQPRVRYCRASAETLALAPECLDLVVSSLALHYVVGYGTLIRRIAGWLRPGGHLVYSIEHPICTARDPMTGWVAAEGGTRTSQITADGRPCSSSARRNREQHHACSCPVSAIVLDACPLNDCLGELNEDR